MEAIPENCANRKRKSVYNDVIFEVGAEECSPEPSPEPQQVEDVEPAAKIKKLEENHCSEDAVDSGFSSQSQEIENSQIIVKETEVETVVVDETAEVTEDTSVNSLQTENLVDSLLTEKSGDDIIISIDFKSETVAEIYKPRFETFIRSLFELEVLNLDNNCLRLDIKLADDSKPAKTRKRNRKKKPKPDLFTVDTNPSLSTKEHILRYSSKFAVIQDVEEIPEENKRSTQSCFNCGECHSLRDCPKPKDYNKIDAARQKFRLQPKSARYHKEEEHVYGHLVPGKISEKLRKALNVRKNELPQYIYRMRIIGYPPGWVDEAQVSHSELNLYDIEGRDVAGKSGKKRGFDSSKIVEYPGFNVPMEKGVHDDFRFHNVPPFSEEHSKQAMIDYILKSEVKKEDNLESCDMEVENDVDVEKEVVDVVEKEVLVEKKSLVVLDPVNRDSPSLTDLEIQKKQLLAELGSSTTETKSDEDSCSVVLETPPVAIESDQKEICPVELEVSAPESPKQTAEVNIVKTSAIGTPILKSASPYSKLPKQDNFSQNISPVINFENLPDSTGKYEQMTGVLQKVRNTMKHLQNKSQS